MMPRWLTVVIALAMLTMTGSTLALVYLHSPYTISIALTEKDQSTAPKPMVVHMAPEVAPEKIYVPTPILMQVPEQVAAAEPIAAPVPLPKSRPPPVRHAKKRSGAVAKLKTKWVEPEAKPFAFTMPRFF